MDGTRLTLIGKVSDSPNPYGLYKCGCGNVKKIRIANVKNNHTTSCGCLFRRKLIERNTVHGLAKHPLYKVWCNIKKRCNNANSPDYNLYGGRGVTICEEWVNDFENFYQWCIDNGWQRGLQIDKDIKGGMVYSPSNCMIVSNKENGNHRRNNRFIEHNGITKTLTEWSEQAGISHYTIRARMKNLNWSFEKAMNTPLLK